ncbi:MAG TPA: DUF2723 domain-containing protein [Candidatus Kapabacteria bacterium]|nr:DUF2723 domain-containing protein [Candidatus Kapabacteria bacterium]
MNNKVLHQTFATLSFLLAAIVYTMTVQPSVPFWDCGEFSAAATWQQVPHPPGAPLFLMIGKLFQVIIPFGDLGWRVNLAAVFSSAFTVLFTYLIAVRMIKSYKGEPNNLGDAIAMFGSGFIAAAALTFSDTMWFNSVESEVYATSLTFVALIVWLMMKWYDKADEPGHERWLFLIAYLIGLSTGVHLLAILTIFSIIMLVYFRKYEFRWQSFIIMGLASIAIFVVIYPGIVTWLPSFLAGHTASRNDAFEYAVEGSNALTVVALLVIFAAIAGFVYGKKKDINWLTIASASFLLILFGYTTYTQILLRSNANPPMNENEPKNFSKLSSYLGREQYGNAPTWPRRYQTDDYFIERYTLKDSRGEYVYGEWFPPSTVPFTTKNGDQVGVKKFTNINTSGEINYMIQYQMNHMFWRYFGWNFIGRKSDVQDAGVAWFSSKDDPEIKKLNHGSGYINEFPVRFFALPLIFGLIGMFYHFKHDRKMALVYLSMFLVMGVLAALQQNQQDPQPRERDYFYSGAFFVWTLWIGIGAFTLMESLAKRKMTPVIAGSVFLGSLILVPINMAVGGWKIHSRAGNYLPFDYSYNILQSLEKDAILFTNGDNDTFPVWWIQDVAGVRRDVRVVNLSLGNTLWYIDQLKNRMPWGANKLPLSFSNASLQNFDENQEGALSYDFGEPQNVVIPVRREILAKYTNDENILNDGNMRFVFAGKPYGERNGKQTSLFRVQDKLILDILKQVKFERPVYFSTTVGPDAFAGLDPYFRYEGMAMRVCPVQQKRGGMEAIDDKIMEQCLMNVDNSDFYSKEPKYGFKMRNLNNRSVYYDEVHRRLMTSYRSLYMTYAAFQLNKKNNSKAIAVIDKMNSLISPEQFPLSFDIAFRLAKIYDEAGAKDKAKEYAILGIKLSEYLINNPDIAPEYMYYEAMGRGMGPYNVSSMLYETLGDYDNALRMLTSLSEYMKQAVPDLQNNQQAISSYYGLQREIKRFEVLSYNKKNGLEATEKFVKGKTDELMKEPNQENMFYIKSYEEALQELKPKDKVSDTLVTMK